MSINWGKIETAAVAILAGAAAIDDSNIVGQVCRQAIKIITTFFGATS